MYVPKVDSCKRNQQGPVVKSLNLLTLMHSERPKLHTILAFPSAIGLKKIEHVTSLKKIEHVTALKKMEHVTALKKKLNM